MSRQRFIYPETFTSDDFNSLTIEARLLFIGMFTTADDYGRGRASARTLKATVFPADTFDLETVALWRAELMARGMILVYESEQNGTIVTFYQISKWDKYQRPKYKSPSKIPCFQHDAGTRDKSGTNPGQFVPSSEEKRGEEKSSVVGCGEVRSGVVGGPRETPTSANDTDGRWALGSAQNRDNGGQDRIPHEKNEIETLLKLAQDRKSQGGRTKLAEAVIADLERERDKP